MKIPNWKAVGNRRFIGILNFDVPSKKTEHVNTKIQQDF